MNKKLILIIIIVLAIELSGIIALVDKAAAAARNIPIGDLLGIQCFICMYFGGSCLRREVLFLLLPV